MIARMARNIGIVLSTLTVAACALQGSVDDGTGPLSLTTEGMSTNHTRVASGPTAKEWMQAMDRATPGGRDCAQKTTASQDCSGDIAGMSVAQALAGAAAQNRDAEAQAAQVAENNSGDENGPLAHALPISASAPDASAFHQEGNASWYGRFFHGRRTASGEPYDMHEMTAAHRTLPLLSYARVTNVFNHRSVIVKINDRGPFHGHRILDVSLAAAKALGMTGSGTERVEITGLSPAEAANALSAPLLASR